MLSDIFFEELNIRKPDYNLEIGGPGKEHFHQAAELSIKFIELIREKKIDPDLICFLGDSNSVTASIPLKKEGYKIAHIEAGMRSGDKRMLEEINRIVCDQCSDYLFVYHNNYKQKAINENINPNNIFVVGNTIVEVVKEMQEQLAFIPKGYNHIILDIHRPENFNDRTRLENIIEFAVDMGYMFNLPVKMLNFGRTEAKINKWNIKLHNIEVIPLTSFKNYIGAVYNSKFMISDSGTAQEEPALFNTPVIVPRDFTERPESVWSNCSFMIDVNSSYNATWGHAFSYINFILNNELKMDTQWLGDGNTSQLIVDKIKEIYGN
jgi:UDP-N-acetylglucosamine 2-epimerase (non-hydrolysing)